MELDSIDRRLSERLFTLGGSAGLRRCLMLVEYSLHGVPWLLATAAALLYCGRPPWQSADGGGDGAQCDAALVELLLHVLIVLCVDGASVGCVKLVVRRRRPPCNDAADMVAGAPIADRYSFPSGHASRAAALATVVCSWPAALDTRRLYFSAAARHSALAAAVLAALSRVAMRRHYFSDALAGLAFGVMFATVVVYFSMPLRAWQFAARALFGTFQ